MANQQKIPSSLISDTAVFDYRTPATKVISALKRYPAVVVNKGKEYLGIVDTRALYRSHQGLKLSTGQSIEKFVIKAPKITSATSTDDLVSYFYRAHAKALPFMEGKKITGVLSRKTLLKMLLSYGVLDGIKVNEAMTSPLLAVDAKWSIAQAKTIMRDHKVNKLAVLDNDRFVGIISNYDLVQGFTKTQERLPQMKTEIYTASNVPLESMMERNPKSIEFNRSLSEAVRDLIENNISSLMVLRKGKPVGILTVTDVLESVLARKRVEPERIFITGLDSYTYQFEPEIREKLQSFISEMERLKGIDVDFVTLRIRRIKSKEYELQTRLSLGNKGIINMHSLQFTFDDALNDLLTKLEHKVKREKERILTVRKVNALREQE
ncbi:MAG: CBS domain-containing protein [Candidatus Micrarchaeota archaeon]|nr:CBS domain-containing protein [Candidatus Micrarchaeota archaeon]